MYVTPTLINNFSSQAVLANAIVCTLGTEGVERGFFVEGQRDCAKRAFRIER